MMMNYREAEEKDLQAIAEVQTESAFHNPHYEVGDFAKELEWRRRRIVGYYRKTHSPLHALEARVIYVAEQDKQIIGFIAGHLSKRFD